MKKLYLKSLTLILVILTVAACNRNTMEGHLNEANTYIDANEFDRAVIELKNAIQLDPQNIVPRILLAQVYLSLGDIVFAEKEINKAIRLGEKSDSIYTMLARVYFLQQNYQDILDLIDSVVFDTNLNAELSFYFAQALLMLGDEVEGEKLLKSLSEGNSKNKFNLLASAYFHSYTKDFESALLISKELIDVHPRFPDAHFLLANLEHAQKNYAASITSYKKYNELLPRYIFGRILLTDALIKNKQHTEAEKEVDALLTIDAEHPLFNQFKAVCRMVDNDYEQTKYYIEKSIMSGFDSTNNRLIAGYANFAMENYSQAYTHFKPVASSLPIDHPIRRTIAYIQLKLGYTDEAKHILSGLTGTQLEDSEILTIASFELMKAADFEAGLELLDKADNVQNKNADLLFKQGLLRLRMEMDADNGLAQLEEAINVGTDVYNAEETLAYMYLKNNQFEKAMQLAHKWQQEEPNNTKGFNLELSIHQKNDQLEQAEQFAQKSLSIDPSDTAALFYLANKNDKAGNFELALEQLDLILNKEELYLPAASLYFVIAKNKGDVDLGIEKLSSLYVNNKDNIPLSILFASTLYAEKKFGKVIELLKGSNFEGYKNKPYWMLLANSYFKLGNVQNAEEVFKQWLQEDPKSMAALFEYVRFYHLTGAFDRALNAAQNAYEKFKDNDRVKLMYIYYLVGAQNFEQADDIMVSVSNEYQKTPLAKSLRGQILARQGKHDQAIPLLTEFYSIKPQSNSTNYLFTALVRSGQEKVAIRLAEKHVKRFPKDAPFRRVYADYLLSQNSQEAISQYKELLKIVPSDYAALNNYAYILLQNNLLNDAEKAIEQAIVIKPEHPSLLDTAGLIQIALGNKKKAINYLQQAKELAPDNEDIYKNYNTALNM